MDDEIADKERNPCVSYKNNFTSPLVCFDYDAKEQEKRNDSADYHQQKDDLSNFAVIGDELIQFEALRADDFAKLPRRFKKKVARELTARGFRSSFSEPRIFWRPNDNHADSNAVAAHRDKGDVRARRDDRGYTSCRAGAADTSICNQRRPGSKRREIRRGDGERQKTARPTQRARQRDANAERGEFARQDRNQQTRRSDSRCRDRALRGLHRGEPSPAAQAATARNDSNDKTQTDNGHPLYYGHLKLLSSNSYAMRGATNSAKQGFICLQLKI